MIKKNKKFMKMAENLISEEEPTVPETLLGEKREREKILKEIPDEVLDEVLKEEKPKEISEEEFMKPAEDEEDDSIIALEEMAGMPNK